MGLTIGFDATAAVQQAAGIGRYTRELLAALSARDDAHRYRVYYCARGKGEGALLPLNGRFELRALPVSDRIMNAVWHRCRLPVPAQLLTGQFDLFHSPDFTLPPTLGKPAVLTVHDLAFLRVPSCAYPTLRAYLQAVVPRSARRAARIIAVSENTRQDVIELLHLPPERVCTVLEGVGQEFRPLAPDAALDAAHRLSIQEPYILSVGTLEPRKNYTRLLDAYALLRERGVSHPLVIAGARGWLYEPILRRIHELHLEDHVLLAEPRNADLPALYSGAEVFVYPSLYEGFGIPPLEALACGAPVVCSSASSLPEVVGDAALTFNPLEVEEIAATIWTILSDTGLRENLKARGPLRAARFTWSHAAAETVRVYEEAADAA